MAWVRIHDAALTHPKVVGLSDKAFRLWVWGLSYSQQHLTDGLIPSAALPAKLQRVPSELVLSGLWEGHENGFRVHDYLEWNDSKETILKKRTGLKKRVDNFRSRDTRNALQPPQRARVTGRSATSGVVSNSSLGEKDDALFERAGRLREELYPAWYAHYRHGARLRLIASTLEYQDALTLVQTWDDATIEKLARIVLTTDDPFISGTDRGFRIFALKASWADDRLKQAESGVA